jgi:4'-phosphopantetheinyl transferase
MSTIGLNWNPPPLAKAIDLPEGAVHVWRATVSAFNDRSKHLAATLSNQERARAGRYRQEADRHRFLIARGLLRQLAGHYLRLAPPALPLIESEFGKPALPPPYQLQFNLSHSHDLIALAFARDRRVGIDLEKINPQSNLIDLASQFCSADEMEALRHSPQSQQQQTFFRLWVRKEAILKATGEGFSRSPFELTVNQSGSKMPWQLQDLAIDPDYAAAIAIEGSGAVLHGWDANQLQL